MRETERYFIWVNIASILMLVYAIILLIGLRIENWPTIGLLLLSINIVNFLLSLFYETNKKITAVVCIIVGVFSLFFFKGSIFWAGLVLAIYGLLLLIRLYLNN